MPRPGAQVLISSRLSGLAATRISAKPAAREPGLDLLRRGRAGDAAADQRRVGGEIGRQRRGADDVGDGEPAARFQHAERLAEHLRLVGDEIDHAIRDHDIGRCCRRPADARVRRGGTRRFRRRSWPRSRAPSPASRGSCRRRSPGPRHRPAAPPENSRSRRRCRDRRPSRPAASRRSPAGCRSRARDWRPRGPPPDSTSE